MASLDQLVAFVQNLNANVSNLTNALANGALSPRVAGGTLGFSIGTASAALVTVATTQPVTFHNLSTAATVYVCPAFDLNNNALTAGQSGGNYAIGPQGTNSNFRTIVVGAGPWLAAASATGTPFTVGFGVGQ